MTSTGKFAPIRRRLMPEGVDASLWSYATSDRLASEETAFFADHPLCTVDLAWIESVLGPGPGLVADLGCGSGRAAARLADLGWDVLAIDLSRPMLATLNQEHRPSEEPRSGSILTIQANLARLDFLPAESIDAAVCLFSTLGMLPDLAVRRRFLAGVASSLVSGGKLLLHVHNWWVQKSTAQGRRWMFGDAIRRMAGTPDFGNREARYRGIPGVRIHCFTWPEITSELARAGFGVRNVISLDAASARDLGPGFANRRVHAGGWLIEAGKSDVSTGLTRASESSEVKPPTPSNAP